MSGDEPQRRDRGSERENRAERAREEGDDRADDGGSSRTRPEPPSGGDSGSSGMVDDVPVSKSLLGGFGGVLAIYVLLTVALALTGILLLNLFGGRRAIPKGFLALGVIGFYTLVGPVLAAPLGLWLGEGTDSLLAAVPSGVVANGLGTFGMALFAFVFLAVEANGLEVVHLILPSLFAGIFAGFVGGISAAVSGFLS